MKKFGFFILLSAVMLITACIDSLSRERKKIESLEKVLFEDTTGIIDQVKADELIRAYIDYADAHPGDTAAPAYIFKAGDLMMNLENPAQSIELFERITRDYPDFRKADVAFFLQAFIYENNLGNLAKAGELYRQFLMKYPQSDFADDAQACLQNLGKSPEDLIREFEQRQADASGSPADSSSEN